MPNTIEYVGKVDLKHILEKLKDEIDKGGGGTSDYEQLTNLPSINDVEIKGNKTLQEYGGANYFKGTTAEVLEHYGITSIDDIPEGNITTITDIEPESSDVTADEIDYIAPYKDEEEVSNVKEGLDYLFKGEFWDVDNRIHKVTKEYMYYKNDEYSDPFYRKSSIYIRSRSNNVLCKQTNTRSPGQVGTQIPPSYKRDNGYMDAKGHYYIGEFTIYRFDLPESNKYYTFYTLAGTDDLIIYLDMPLSMEINNKQDAATAITTDNISQQSVAHATTADTATMADTATTADRAITADSATDDTKLPLTGGSISGDIKPDETGKYYIGTADNAFNGVYARTVASRFNGGTYGSINVATEGTETTTGACRLTVGNSSASGTDKNAYGEIRLFNTGTNYVGLRTSNDLTANRTIYLPATSGTKTLAIDDEATTTDKGLMSAADKTKLDGIAEGANKTTTANNLTTTAAGSVLDARQGRALANGSARDSTKLPLTGGTISGVLTCQSTLSATNSISITGSGSVIAPSLIFYNPSVTWSPAKVTHDGAQNLRLAATEEGYDVNIGVSSSAWTWYPSKDNTIGLGTAKLRWKQLFAGTTTISTSDRNEKKDISDIPNFEDFILNLKPVSFKFKDGTSGRTHYGFIAQDVEETLHELGMTSLDFAGLCKDSKEDGSDEYIYGLRYEEFIAPLVATVQQQQKEIDELKSAIEELKTK